MSVGSAQQNHASVSRGRRSTSPRSAGRPNVPGIGHRPIQGPKRRHVVDLRRDIGLDDFGELAMEAIQLRIPGLPVIGEAVVIVFCRCGVISGRSSSSEPLGTSRRIVYWIGSTLPTISLAITKSRISRMSLRCRPGRERQPRRADLDPMLAQQGHRPGGLVGGVTLVEIGEDLGVERLERRDHEEAPIFAELGPDLTMLEDVLDLGRAVEGDLGKLAVKLARHFQGVLDAV